MRDVCVRRRWWTETDHMMDLLRVGLLQIRALSVGLVHFHNDVALTKFGQSQVYNIITTLPVEPQRCTCFITPRLALFLDLSVVADEKCWCILLQFRLEAPSRKRGELLRKGRVGYYRLGSDCSAARSCNFYPGSTSW